MKKILLLIILLVPINVSAMSMELSCDKSSVYTGENVICTVKVKDKTVSGGEANISVTNGNITSYSKVSCGSGEVTKDDFSCTDEITNNSLTLASYTIKAGGNGTMSIVLSNITVVGNDFEEDHPSNIVKNISVIERPTTTTTTRLITQAPTTQAPVTNEVTTVQSTESTTEVTTVNSTTTSTTTVRTTVPTVSPKTEEKESKSPIFYVKLIGSSIGLMACSYFLLVVLKH